MTSKRVAKSRPIKPYLTTASPEDLEPASRIVYDVVHDRRDVLPSVGRIMDAGLDDETTLRAMTLFRDALMTTGDPHRDPRVAIAASTPAF